MRKFMVYHTRGEYIIRRGKVNLNNVLLLVPYIQNETFCLTFAYRDPLIFQLRGTTLYGICDMKIAPFYMNFREYHTSYIYNVFAVYGKDDVELRRYLGIYHCENIIL